MGAKDHSVSQHADKDGNFRRQDAQFRNTISAEGPHQPEKGRYIIYAALICPWASRTLHVRSLKGLESIIDVAILDYELTPRGWTFDTRTKEATGDPVYGAEGIRDIYHKHDPEYDLRYTVPVLFDKKLAKIVNNESSEIIRILYTSFDELLPPDSPSRGLTYYPSAYASQIDSLNSWIYPQVNNGVYRTGFAGSQQIYEDEIRTVFSGLDKLEAILSDGRTYLVPEAGLSEADIRLYPTLVRFDAAYHTIFKCNINSIRAGYPHLHRYLRHLYWDYPAFKDWTNFEHIKKGYSGAGPNKSNIVPYGPIPSILPKDA